MARSTAKADVDSAAAPTGARDARRPGTNGSSHRDLMQRLGLNATRGGPKPIGHRYDLAGRRWDYYEWPNGTVVEAGPFCERW